MLFTCKTNTTKHFDYHGHRGICATPARHNNSHTLAISNIAISHIHSFHVKIDHLLQYINCLIIFD